MKKLSAIFIASLWLILPGVAQVGGNVDSTAGYTFTFVDNDSDGINDNYQTDKMANPGDYQNSPTLNIQYKYEFGTGYGYGFSDNDRNGTNDIVDNSPGITGTNPMVGTTRLEGIEMIKRGTIRHGKNTEPTGMTQKMKEHVLHDGHCKDERYDQYRNSSGN